MRPLGDTSSVWYVSRYALRLGRLNPVSRLCDDQKRSSCADGQTALVMWHIHSCSRARVPTLCGISHLSSSHWLTSNCFISARVDELKWFKKKYKIKHVQSFLNRSLCQKGIPNFLNKKFKKTIHSNIFTKFVLQRSNLKKLS